MAERIQRTRNKGWRMPEGAVYVGRAIRTALGGRRRLPRWACVQVESGPVHVIPIGDLVRHRMDDTCICGPTTEAVFRDDGSNGWVYTHHSLDGREANE